MTQSRAPPGAPPAQSAPFEDHELETTGPKRAQRPDSVRQPALKCLTESGLSQVAQTRFNETGHHGKVCTGSGWPLAYSAAYTRADTALRATSVHMVTSEAVCLVAASFGRRSTVICGDVGDRLGDAARAG